MNILTTTLIPAKKSVIPVIEENLFCNKKIIETGKVVISKHVTENIETINIPLQHDEHIIEHIPFNTLIDDISSRTL